MDLCLRNKREARGTDASANVMAHIIVKIQPLDVSHVPMMDRLSRATLDTAFIEAEIHTFANVTAMVNTDVNQNDQYDQDAIVVKFLEQPMKEIGNLKLTSEDLSTIARAIVMAPGDVSVICLVIHARVLTAGHGTVGHVLLTEGLFREIEHLLKMYLVSA